MAEKFLHPSGVENIYQKLLKNLFDSVSNRTGWQGLPRIAVTSYLFAHRLSTILLTAFFNGFDGVRTIINTRMGVDLCRCHALVTEQDLNGSQFSYFHQVGCERVT